VTNSIYIATSLDGFIADRDGGLDWLTELPNPEGGDHGFAEFLGRVDAIVMGRATFETVLGFGVWPYDKPVFVLSTTLAEAPADLAGKMEVVRGDPRSLVAALRERGFEDLYVDGGRTIRGFLAADLIDELIITTVSILLGDGVPLFGSIGRTLSFRHVSTAVLSPDLTQSRYVRDRSSERSA
jgi:dihydrofolate reductase